MKEEFMMCGGLSYSPWLFPLLAGAKWRMLNEAIVSWRQKKEEEKKKKSKKQTVPLLSAPTLRSILQHDEVHPSTQAVAT